MDKQQFRKKPIVIDAMQWTGDNADAMQAFLHDGQKETAYGWVIGRYVEIGTIEGTMTASIGDWIIRGIKGEFYPCKPDIFAATYEPADAQPPSASDERDSAEAFAFASTNEPSGLLRHWWRKGYDAGRDRAALAPSPGVDAAEQKPVYTIQVRGALHTWEPTAQAFKLTNGTYNLYAAPAPAASADEWVAEAEKLVEHLEREWVKAVSHRRAPAAAIEARAALLAHLRQQPGQADANG